MYPHCAHTVTIRMITIIKYDLTRANIKYSQSIKSNNKDHCHHICSGLKQPDLLDRPPTIASKEKGSSSGMQIPIKKHLFQMKNAVKMHPEIFNR